MEKIENKKDEVKNAKESFDQTIVIQSLDSIIKKNEKKSQNNEQLKDGVRVDKPQPNKSKEAIQKENVANKELKNNAANLQKQIQKTEENPILKKQMQQKAAPEKKEPVKEKYQPPHVTTNTQKEKYQPPHVNTQPKKEEKKKRTGLIVILFIMIIMVALLVLSTIFALVNNNSENIINGVYVEGVDISNCSKEDAKIKLQNELNSNEKNHITVSRNGVEQQVYLSDINGSFDVDSAVENAYQVGRNGNLFQNNYEILFTNIFKSKAKATFKYDKELLSKKIDELSIKIPDIALDSSYIISDNKVIIKNRTVGYKIKKDDFEKDLVNAFSSSNKAFEIKVEPSQGREINLEEIQKEIYVKPENAYYTKNPPEIHVEKVGRDFGITLVEAKKLLEENKDEYEIPLKELQPAVRVKDLDAEAFPNLLGSFTTYYGTADTGRNENIRIAARSITQAIVMPGETFSFNDLIGECSTRTGYKESTIYLNGELSKGIGGGICQVSTTLYNAVLRANLEIVQRRNHSLSVTYVPLGQDAMVSIGSSDFKFKNNRSYPIKVVASTATGSITCQIFGLKNDTEYEVKLDTKVISKTDTKTKTQTYKVLYLNGREVSRTLLSTDTYKNH